MIVRTSAGTTLKMSAAQPATYDSTGYAALTYTTIGEVTNLGEIGREYNLVTHQPLASRGTVKKKGSFNDGQLTINVGLDNSDAGQTLLKTALASDNDYSFLVTLQDGAKRYFQGQVMSFKTNVGGVDDITAATITVEITTNSAGVGIVEVAAP